MRFLLCDFGGIGGLKSNFGSMVDALQGGQSGGGVGALLENLFLPERWAANFEPKFRRQVREAYRALRDVDAREPLDAVVLWFSYGPRNRMRDWPTFGDSAQIAHLTPTAQALAVRATSKLRSKLAEDIVARMTYDAAIAPLVTHQDTVWAGSIDEIRARAAASDDPLVREECAFQIRQLKKRRMRLDPRASDQREIPTVEAVAERSTVHVTPAEAVASLVNERAYSRAEQSKFIADIKREAEHMHREACVEYMATITGRARPPRRPILRLIQGGAL